MTLNPKKYISDEIIPSDCSHDILLGNGHDEGIYGYSYSCLICLEHLHFSGPYKLKDESKFIKYDYGALTPDIRVIMQDLLRGICLTNIEKNNINIVNMFKKYDNLIDSKVRESLVLKYNSPGKQKVLKKLN